MDSGYQSCPRFKLAEPLAQIGNLNADGAQLLRRICGWRFRAWP
jgi:hypothetical protein